MVKCKYMVGRGMRCAFSFSGEPSRLPKGVVFSWSEVQQQAVRNESATCQWGGSGVESLVLTLTLI